MDAAVEELQFLSQSENRVRTLTAISADGPLDRDALEARLDASHRTVIRIVNAMTDRGYLRETPNGFALTTFGALVTDCLAEFVADTGTVLEYRPLLEHAPPSLREMPLDALDGAELVVAAESDPFAVLDRMLSLRAEATEMREIAPGVERKSIDQLARRVRDDADFDAEIVIPAGASEAAESRPEYRDQHLRTLESGRVDIYVSPEPIRFAASVVGDTAAVAVMRNEQPHAIAVSDDPEMRAWVRDLFEEYRAEATLKTAD